jgi:hypothetical protein
MNLEEFERNLLDCGILRNRREVNFDRVFDHNISITHVYMYALEREENDGDGIDTKISIYRVRLPNLLL